VQVVTAAQIERRGYRSVLDVLNDLADFKVDLAGNVDYPAQLTVQGTSLDELIGAPQNPRRLTVGSSLRVG
jgi:outer membrane cobalamin receptor